MTEPQRKVLLTSTTVFSLPLQGYGGLEQLAWLLAEGLHARGWRVSLVCPEGSRLAEGIEHIPCGLMEDEEKTWARYRGRLEAGEWPVVVDASWQRWAMMSSAGRDPQLPIVNWFHSSPSVYMDQPPVKYPMWVGLSKSHSSDMSLTWKVPSRYVYNCIDTDFYRANGQERGGRYCWVARYTVEKNPLDIIDLAQRLRTGVDLYGDTHIVGSLDYVKQAMSRADGFFARAYPGVSREAVVDVLSTHVGMLFLPLWQEPFGLTVLESMACGCPPICGRRGAIPELIKDGVTGFLVDGLEQMEEIIRKGAVREIDAGAMRQHVENYFSLEKFVSRWEDLLQRVLKGERW